MKRLFASDCDGRLWGFRRLSGTYSGNAAHHAPNCQILRSWGPIGGADRFRKQYEILHEEVALAGGTGRKENATSLRVIRNKSQQPQAIANGFHPKS